MPNLVIYRIWQNLTLACSVAPVLKNILAQVGLGLHFNLAEQELRNGRPTVP